VRRGTDIINPGTPRCNIMLLADHADGSVGSLDHHYFLYARVLGAYHANVIYTGPGMRDYAARRFDFLWVRWFEVIDSASSGWCSSTLDVVRFPPMHGNESFGFVDPKDVLRGCHILPVFAKGRRQANGVSISRCAKDGKDYKQYYVGRCVQQQCDDSDPDMDPRFSDRDLVMRYHWGLAVGHLHVHQPISMSGPIPGDPESPRNTQDDDDQFPDFEVDKLSDENAHAQDGDSIDYDSDNPDLGLEERDLEGWEDVETDSGSEGDGCYDSEDMEEPGEDSHGLY
jgi:hypothetical protein